MFVLYAHGCFQSIEKECNICDVKSIHLHDEKALSLTTARKLTLTSKSLEGIQQFLEIRKSVSSPILVSEKAASKPCSSTAEECWVQYGGIILNRKHLQQVVQGKELCDLHVNAFQSLLKRSFPQIDGLLCTLFQNKKPLQLTTGTPAIQILFTR